MYFLRKQSVFFKSLFWGTFAGVASQGLNFLTNIFIARFLGEALFGEMTFYVSVNAALQTFVVFGLNVISTLLVAKDVGRKNVGELISQIYFIVFCLSLFISIIFLFLYIAGEIPFVIENSIYLFALIVWLVASSVDSVQIGILIGLKAFKEMAITSFLKGFISFFAVILLIYRYGLLGGLIGYAFSFSCCLMLNFYFIRIILKKQKVVLSFFCISVKKMFGILCLGFPIFLASLFISPAQSLAYKLVFDQENGTSSLGIFGMANQWLVLIQFFPLQIAKVVLPFLVSQSKEAENVKIEKIGLFVCLFISFVVAFFAFVFKRFIIVDLYHFDYNISHLPFTIMLLAGLFSTLNLYLGQTIIARGLIWIRTIADFLIAISLIAVVWVTMKHNLLLSLPFGYLVSFIVGTVFLFILGRRYEN